MRSGHTLGTRDALLGDKKRRNAETKNSGRRTAQTLVKNTGEPDRLPPFDCITETKRLPEHL